MYMKQEQHPKPWRERERASSRISSIRSIYFQENSFLEKKSLSLRRVSSLFSNCAEPESLPS